MLRNILLLLLATTLLACGSSRPASQVNTVNDGYGEVSKKNNTGTISSAKGSNTVMPLEMQISRLPGVTVRGQGAGAEIRIRGGNNSFSLSTEPLFVLDGQPINGGFATVHSVVNINDLDDISVLKGSSASMYGSRGANGVILIRTKK